MTILDLIGKITLGEGSGTLRDTVRRLVNDGNIKILLNMAEASYVDSSGLGELVSGFTVATNMGGIVKLLAVPERVEKIFRSAQLYTVFEIFDSEDKAVKSFDTLRFPSYYCLCPVCGRRSGPPLFDQTVWEPQQCHNCRAKFTLADPSRRDEAQVLTLRAHGYIFDYFEIICGSPFTYKIVGRLTLFSSSALKETWNALPRPRRVVFDFTQAKEIEDGGRVALLDLLAKKDKEDKAIIFLEGLSPDQAKRFHKAAPVYADKSAALKALGDVSDTPPWVVRITRTA